MFLTTFPYPSPSRSYLSIFLLKGQNSLKNHKKNFFYLKHLESNTVKVNLSFSFLLYVCCLLPTAPPYALL
jgi:hypothetical protein